MDQLGIGSELRRAREARGLSIEAAAEATRIRARHIQALEDEDLETLPHPVFATGLLRSYAAFLGLDPNVMAARLGVQPEMRPRAAIQSEAGLLRPVTSIAPRLVGITLVLIVSVLLVYILYTEYAKFVASGQEARTTVSTPAATRPPQPSPTIGIAIVPPAVTPSAPPAVTPTRQPSPQAVAQPTGAASPVATATATLSPTMTPVEIVVIQAKFLDRVWVQVEVDDKVATSKTFNAGEQAEWRGKKVFLWTGSAYSVDITYNGKPLGRLGARGELVKVTWTAR
jgi:cytoskeleton protein RodZ